MPPPIEDAAGHGDVAARILSARCSRCCADGFQRRPLEFPAPALEAARDGRRGISSSAAIVRARGLTLPVFRTLGAFSARRAPMRAAMGADGPIGRRVRLRLSRTASSLLLPRDIPSHLASSTFVRAAVYSRRYSPPTPMPTFYRAFMRHRFCRLTTAMTCRFSPAPSRDHEALARAPR